MKKLVRVIMLFVFTFVLAGMPEADVRAAMLGEEPLPAAYMNDIDEVNARFPATREQKYDDCWSFSTVGLAEFDLIVDNGVVDRTVDFSELELNYATYHFIEDAFGGLSGDRVTLLNGKDFLTLGGNLNFAVQALLQWKGLTAESFLPYEQARNPLTVLGEEIRQNCEAHLQNVYRLSMRKNRNGVKREIMRHGAAGISFYAATGALEKSRYTGSAAYRGKTVPTYYCYDSSRYANHAVNIIGWDDDFPADNFANPAPENGAWLVRNSWSSSGTYNTDTSAYFWMSYCDKSLTDEVWILDFEEADNYDYNYQYDGGIFCENVSSSLDYDAVANVFQVKGEKNEALEAVLFQAMENANVSYTIRIYTDLRDPAKPDSGYLAATLSGKADYAGAHTIPLEDPVPLAKGSLFSVVVEETNVDVECGIKVRSYGYMTEVSLDEGQSFARTGDGWIDMKYVQSTARIKGLAGVEVRTGNWCIKAYTGSLGGKKVAKVSKLKKQETTADSITLKWDEVSGASGYEIFRSTSPNGVYKKVAAVKGGAKTTYKDSGLKKDKTYFYCVRAYRNVKTVDEDGNGGRVTVVGRLSDVKAVKTKKGGKG